jgi:hypothetical protein
MDQRKSGSSTRKTVAVTADKNTENEYGDDLKKKHNGRGVDAYADNLKRSK